MRIATVPISPLNNSEDYAYALRFAATAIGEAIAMLAAHQCDAVNVTTAPPTAKVETVLQLQAAIEELRRMEHRCYTADTGATR